jgi:hypothetical protein
MTNFSLGEEGKQGKKNCVCWDEGGSGIGDGVCKYWVAMRVLIVVRV